MTTRTGLRRFVGKPPEPSAPPGPEARAEPVEQCELCGTVVGPRHGHVVDIEHRSLMCACRPCFLLFTKPEAAAGRYRAVPERYLCDAVRPLTTAEWERVGIPVASAFFLRSADGIAAFYPSPAGATECLLDLDAWADLVAAHPMVAAAERETEAILIRADAGAPVECYLVPVDACYQLVGVVRRYWKGFDGGQEAHEHIDEFFAGIRDRATPFLAEG